MPILSPSAPASSQVLQAPVVLSTGALARYSLQRNPSFSTRYIKFSDFSRQTFAQIASELGRWHLNLAMMQDSEADDWLNLWRATKAGNLPFAFLDPAANLLTYSETFENEAWQPSSGNVFVGQNYLAESQDFEKAPWALSNVGASNPVITPDSQVAPDGTFTADTVSFPLIPNTSGDNSIVSQVCAPPVTAGMQFTFSVWMRVPSGTGTITLQIGDSPFSQSATQVCNLTTTWQRFSVSYTFNSSANSEINCAILNPQNSATIVVWIWGAQLEYGPGIADYTVTSSQSVALAIADPLFQQAPSSVPGYQWNLNSTMPRRGRQLVAVSAGSLLQRILPLLVSGTGNSRSNGLTLAFSCWFKAASSSPNVSLAWGDISGNETGSVTPITPPANWKRFSGWKQFSPSNPDVNGTIAGIGSLGQGVFYVFGAQLETGQVASGYKTTQSYSGFRPNCYFANDAFGHVQSEFNQSTVTLEIEESA